MSLNDGEVDFWKKEGKASQQNNNDEKIRLLGEKNDCLVILNNIINTTKSKSIEKIIHTFEATSNESNVKGIKSIKVKGG